MASFEMIGQKLSSCHSVAFLEYLTDDYWIAMDSGNLKNRKIWSIFRRCHYFRNTFQSFQTVIQLRLKLGFVVLIVRIPEETMTLSNDHPKDQEKWGLDPCHDCQRLKCREDCTLVTKTPKKSHE